MRGLSAKTLIFFFFVLTTPSLSLIAEPSLAGAAELNAPAREDKFLNLLPEKYRKKALGYERLGELHKALQAWEIISGFNPGNKALAEKISDLKIQITSRADEHFQKGIAYYKNNSTNAARKEFLLALSYNPAHKEALEYIKDKLSGEDYMLYEVKKGDTVYAIANKMYGDSGKAFLIMHFNDLDKKVLTIGDLLKIPVLEPLMTKAMPEAEEIPDKFMETEEMPVKTEAVVTPTQELIGKAQNLFKEKKYEEVVSISEKIMEHEPKNKIARDLLNTSCYELGKADISAKKYEEALRFLSRVDPKYKDIKKVRAVAEKRLADIHYKTGVNYFVNEELDKAITEWKTTLTLNPNHEKAKKDIENARGLLEKLQKIK